MRLNNKHGHFKSNYPYWFMLPGLLVFTIFFLLPVCAGIYYSMTYWNFNTAKFCGLENYKYIFSQDNFRRALSNTLIFTALTTTVTFVLSLLLALFLNRPMRLRGYFRTVSYLPVVMNYIAVGVAFTFILHPSSGLLNNFLRSIGLDSITRDWLFDPKINLIVLSGIQVWKEIGFFTLILLAGLQTIPEVYYEAATLDGVNSFQKLVKITVPLLMPQINNVLVLLLVKGIKVFDVIMATTKGGPGYQSSTLNIFAYESMSFGRAGESCAAMVVLAIFCGVIGIGLANFLRKREVEI